MVGVGGGGGEEMGLATRTTLISLGSTLELMWPDALGLSTSLYKCHLWQVKKLDHIYP